MQLDNVFQGGLKDIAQDFASAGFAHRAGDEFVGGRIDVVDLEAGEALFEERQDDGRVDLRQSAVEVNRTPFLDRRLVQIVETLGPDHMRPRNYKEGDNQRRNYRYPTEISDHESLLLRER